MRPEEPGTPEQIMGRVPAEAAPEGPRANVIAAKAAARDVKVTILIDFIEYLWKAAWCFHPARDPAAEDWVTAQGLAILHGRGGPGHQHGQRPGRLGPALPRQRARQDHPHHRTTATPALPTQAVSEDEPATRLLGQEILADLRVISEPRRPTPPCA